MFNRVSVNHALSRPVQTVDSLLELDNWWVCAPPDPIIKLSLAVSTDPDIFGVTQASELEYEAGDRA